MATRKAPSSLLLRVQTEATHATATLAASKTLEAPFDGSEDKTLIFCADLMPNRAATPESLALRAGIPPNCTIQYLQPRHQDNPLAVSSISDDGYENVVQGGWCVLMSAPSLVSLALVISGFFTLYMGIGQPIRDNGFLHSKATHKYITRKNKVGSNSWNTTFTVKLEVIGVATPAVQQFVRQVMSTHTFLTWSGKFCADVMGDFSPHFLCECTSHEDIEEKWKITEDARLGSANAGSPTAAASILPTIPIALPRLPANVLVQQQTPLGGSAMAPVLQQQSPFGGGGVRSCVQPLTPTGLLPVTASAHPITALGGAPKTPTGVQPWRPQDVACPQTPPKTMLLPVPLQPGSPAKAQRHCPECQSPQLVGRAHICHSTEPNCKRLKMSICDQPSELSQCGVGLQMQDDSHRLCEGEQELFLDALRQALQLIHVDYETVTIQVMVRDAKWDDLKAIQASVDFLSECVAQRHAGVPGCWSKRTALQTIDRVCNDFSKQPLMKRAIAHLQEWGGRCGVFCSIHEVLQDFSASWDLLWERQKEDFVNSNSWQQLQWLTDMRNRLLATLSGDANVERPNQQHALQ